MSRNISEMTKQDKEFMKLRDQVFKKIPQGTKNSKKWKAFSSYMNFYYKKLPSFQDVETGGGSRKIW